MHGLGVTIAHRIATGWSCVDDTGRRRTIPADAVDPQLRDLRVGQRLIAELDAAGTIVTVTLP